jgi:hypothetical protein
VARAIDGVLEVVVILVILIILQLETPIPLFLIRVIETILVLTIVIIHQAALTVGLRTVVAAVVRFTQQILMKGARIITGGKSHHDYPFCTSPSIF